MNVGDRVCVRDTHEVVTIIFAQSWDIMVENDQGYAWTVRPSDLEPAVDFQPKRNPVVRLATVDGEKV